MPIPCLFYTDSTSFNRYTERSDVSCPCGYMWYVPHSRLLLLEIQLRRRLIAVLSSGLFCLGLSSNQLCCYHHRHMSFLRRRRPTNIIPMIHPYLPTKTHIYDPAIATNQAPYLWSMHTKQQRSMSMIHEYLFTKINVYDLCIPTHQDKYLWSSHTN